MQAILIRDRVYKTCILGRLFVNDKEFKILERPWLDNRPNQSCIPQGTYKVKPIAKSSSGKYKNVFHVQDVPKRGGILIHNGNIVNHTKGCLVVGKNRGVLAGKRAVLNSKTAMYELYKLIDGNEFDLIVIGGY